MASVTTYKQLAQRLPTTTSTMILYNPPPGSGTISYITSLIVCNTTGSAATYSVWINQNGNVSADQFALIKNLPIAATASDQRIYGPIGLILSGSSASILVASSVGSALNFTIFGYEVVQT